MQTAIPYKALLLLLSAIFAARVFTQFFLQYFSVDFLPPFDLWHSEAMPYLVLFSLQCLLLALMIWGALADRKTARPKLGAVVCSLGIIYLISMLSRVAIGLTESSDRLWFEGAVPTAIHFVLIAYVLVFGASLLQYQIEKSRIAKPVLKILGYPCILIIAYLEFVWMLKIGAPLMFSAYLTVLVGAAMIILHETFAPHREDWRPTRQDLITDGLFLGLVQVAVPALMKFLALALIVWFSQGNTAGGENKSGLADLWPHEAPVLVQVFIMMLIAEFFRYWIHRASHKYIPLWKLHAVHHAADKLYTINVGRFHPLDKAIQFLGDTLPFLLFGLSSEVFAAYFVIYALNGFYQHSNAKVRLGVFNWIIAGPELHRWHHSKNYKEANANFGNNLIVWDSIFGTRFLPQGRSVTTVGIGNPQWPKSFFAQLLAPLTTSTNSTNSSTAPSPPDK